MAVGAADKGQTITIICDLFPSGEHQLKFEMRNKVGR